jgi:hypothetical protein
MSGLASRRLADPRFAWLGLAVPSDARRFRTDDPDLAALLVAAGAELVSEAPDVEIAQPGGLRGDATTAVVPFEPRNRSERSRSRRGVDRVVRSARLSLGRLRASRALRRLGYTDHHTIAWERSIPVVGPGLPKVESRSFAHRWPLNTVAVAHRGAPSPTIFDAVVDAAGRATGQAVRPSRVIFGSSGVIVADLGPVILRLALGPAAVRLHSHRHVVEQLLALDPPSGVEQRVPRVLGHGQEGLAAWTLEERLPGTHRSQLGRDLAGECADFLAHLARLPTSGSPRGRLEDAAQTIEAECTNGVREEVAAAAAKAIDALDELPTCFVHGDFWIGNLLIEEDRLTGVIDWSGGGPDGLPLIDALHLGVSSIRERTGEPLGVAVAVHLLSGNESAASEVLGPSLDRLGMKLSADELRALVVAYWFDALARDLRDPDSVLDRAHWEDDNVAPVLSAIQGRRGQELVMNRGAR